MSTWSCSGQPTIIYQLNFFDLKMCIGYGIEFVVSFIFIQIHVSSLLLNVYKDTSIYSNFYSNTFVIDF